MALEGVKSEKSEENNGNVPDGKANGIDNKSKQVPIWLFNLFFSLRFFASCDLWAALYTQEDLQFLLEFFRSVHFTGVG